MACEIVLNHDHLGEVLRHALDGCRHRLFIATANVKDVHLPRIGNDPRGKRRSDSFFDLLCRLASSGAEVRLLHSAVPSNPMLERLRGGMPESMTMRRCPRVHAKAVIVDGSWMYCGSANLTGAGLGAKSARRRNFEAGIWTDELSLIDAVADMLDEVWSGAHCPDCGRRDHCPVPLEEPAL